MPRLHDSWLALNENDKAFNLLLSLYAKSDPTFSVDFGARIYTVVLYRFVYYRLLMKLAMALPVLYTCYTSFVQVAINLCRWVPFVVASRVLSRLWFLVTLCTMALVTVLGAWLPPHPCSTTSQMSHRGQMDVSPFCWVFYPSPTVNAAHPASGLADA